MWTNEDDVPHNVIGGGLKSETFGKDGTYEYKAARGWDDHVRVHPAPGHGRDCRGHEVDAGGPRARRHRRTGRRHAAASRGVPRSRRAWPSRPSCARRWPRRRPRCARSRSSTTRRPARLSAWVRALGPAVPREAGAAGAPRRPPPCRAVAGGHRLDGPDGLDAESADHREPFRGPPAPAAPRALRAARRPGRGRGERRPTLREGFKHGGPRAPHVDAARRPRSRRVCLVGDRRPRSSSPPTAARTPDVARDDRGGRRPARRPPGPRSRAR